MIEEYELPAERSFIGAWLLKDLSVCDKLIEHFEANNNKRPGVVYSKESNQQLIKKDVKDSIDLQLEPTQIVAREYANELHNVVECYKKKFCWADETGPWGIEAINLQKYNPNGGYFVWHSERSSASINSVYRHLVFMTYLNDVDDCGETEFYYQKIKVKPKKGLTLIWPVDWTHTHRGLPSPSETKYIATGWFRFTPV